MKFSLSWLQEYVPIEMTAADLAEGLTMAGLEVDSVSDRYDYMDTILTGRILEITPHPNADKLKICLVDIGKEKKTIVCGAPNAEIGMITACALPGTVFPNGNVIEVSIIRDQESHGMLCSESEVGTGPDSSGILSLDSGTAIGEKLSTTLNLSDIVIEIDLTPNRPDCLGIIGIAREIAALQGSTLHYPNIEEDYSGTAVFEHTSVEIRDPDLCPRYAAGIVSNVTVEPSPFWLQDRLLSIGLRPINNMVDITNFVMMETGQPLHAFDFDKLFGHRIVVRASEKGESFTTLDGKERTLSPGTLMICDAEKPVALAGVMGGFNSEISQKTTNVLIESACFAPGSIRKTSKMLGLNTDASHRFERGVDPQGTVFALKRAAALTKKITGGTIINGVVDEHPKPISLNKISIGVHNTNHLLGTTLDQTTIAGHLESIDFSVNKIDEDLLEVTVPSFRVDVSRQEDLVEEIARLSGYDNIPTTFPLIPSDIKHPSKQLVSKDQIKDILLGYGFSEAINYSFVKRSACDQLKITPENPKRNVLEILNPLSEDQAVMRTSLISGLLETLHRNISQQVKSLKLFEIGKIFLSAGPNRQPNEIENLACIWTGKRAPTSWHGPNMDCDFYDIKGVAEGLFQALNIQSIKFTALPAESYSYQKPGFTAGIYTQGERIGSVGEVHHEILNNYNVKQPVYILELDLDVLIPLIPESKTSMPLPKFPSVSRDITIIIDHQIESQSVIDSLNEINEKMLEKVQLFDVYEGEHIPSGKKSLSFRLVYRSMEKTLKDDFINEIHTRISETLLQTFQATLP